MQAVDADENGRGLLVPRAEISGTSLAKLFSPAFHKPSGMRESYRHRLLGGVLEQLSAFTLGAAQDCIDEIADAFGDGDRFVHCGVRRHVEHQQLHKTETDGPLEARLNAFPVTELGGEVIQQGEISQRAQHESLEQRRVAWLQGIPDGGAIDEIVCEHFSALPFAKCIEGKAARIAALVDLAHAAPGRMPFPMPR
jgi:hypothetical protein